MQTAIRLQKKGTLPSSTICRSMFIVTMVALSSARSLVRQVFRLMP